MNPTTPDELWLQQQAVLRRAQAQGKGILGGKLSHKRPCACGLRFTNKGIRQHQRRCPIQQAAWGKPVFTPTLQTNRRAIESDLAAVKRLEALAEETKNGDDYEAIRRVVALLKARVARTTNENLRELER